MTVVELVTLGLSIYAACLATALAISKVRQERAVLRFQVGPDHPDAVDEDNEGPSYVVLRVANISRRSIVLTRIGLEFELDYARVADKDVWSGPGQGLSVWAGTVRLEEDDRIQGGLPEDAMLGTLAYGPIPYVFSKAIAVDGDGELRSERISRIDPGYADLGHERWRQTAHRRRRSRLRAAWLRWWFVVFLGRFNVENRRWVSRTIDIVVALRLVPPIPVLYPGEPQDLAV